MKQLLLIVAGSLMFAAANGVSQSMSCSMVNGKQICNTQRSEGGAAMASSSAGTSNEGSFQQVYTGAGDPSGQWGSSHQTAGSGGFQNMPFMTPLPMFFPPMMNPFNLLGGGGAFAGPGGAFAGPTGAFAGTGGAFAGAGASSFAYGKR